MSKPHMIPPFGPRPSLESACEEELAAVRESGRLRGLREIDGMQSPEVSLAGKNALLLCSNNYLGLADRPELAAVAKDATGRFGTSSVSSRLISGHMSVHAELEARLAEWKGQEAALVFSTGYQANVGAISSLVGRGDVVISDELNHASIIDGCRLSKAHVAIAKHNDPEHIEDLLAEHAGARRVMVATESIFSMDGDRAPLEEIAVVAKRHDAWLLVDEAHAAGIFGPRGAGVVSELGLEREVDITIGTLGKALASFGAYVAGSRALVDFLINRARSFIFTTGLPPSAAAVAQKATEIAEAEHDRAVALLERSARLAARLRDEGLNVPHAQSQILPVIIGPEETTMEVMRRLLDDGIYVAGIRPPTVPPGTSRLRVSLMATHTDAQIDHAADAIVSAVRSAS